MRLTTYHHPVPLSRNLGVLTSLNPLGLSRPVMGLLYLFMFRDDLSVPSSRAKQSKEDVFLFDCLNLEDGIDVVSLNIGTQLPIYAA